ncbi:MAG: PKD domain-containing protein, partial [Candidatus Melainabacteria bacterium]|nr:PKD domain-containing protein [Candidatus Melainabacteria bacterium]
MGSKLFLKYKKYVALLLVVLSLTKTISLLAYADTFSVSDAVSIGFVKDGKILRSQKSGNYSVAFGKDRQIVKSSMSGYLSVGVNSSSPVLVESGIPLVNISPTIGVAPQVVTFDAKDVFNPDDLTLGDEKNLTYLWSFGDVIARSPQGDEAIPNEDSNQSIDATTTHTYRDPGVYPVTLTVTNQSGKSSTYTKEIEIRDKNEPPLADVVVSAFETDDYKEATFDASMSLDPEGDLISYTWETGDGIENTGSIFMHRYSTKGTFVPKATLTDALGAKTVKYIEPIEYLGPNIPPTPIADISPSTGYLSPSLLVKLSSKDSFDKDGEITNYTWKIGTENPEVREGEEILYEFNEAGVYEVTLEVTDNRGRVSTKKEEVKVLKPDPIPSALVDKTSGNAPLTVSFSSFGSRDFDGSLVNVRWNFGDGLPDSLEPNPIHTYYQPGAYLATLTVEAPDGRIKKTNTKTIIVAENNGPKGVISTLEPVFLGITGESSIKLSGKDSFDPEFNQMLSYSWSWIAHQIDKNKNLIDVSDAINNQLTENTNEEFLYDFTLPGQYIPILEVTAEDGRNNTVSGETITIIPSQNPVSVAQIVSDKLYGKDSLTVDFNGIGSYDPKTSGNIVSYLWEFGDGNTSSDPNHQYTYNIPGKYNAKLTVQDSRGFKSTALTKTIEVVSSVDTLARIFHLPEVKEKVLKLQESNTQPDGGLGFAKEEEKPQDNTPPQISLWVENPKLNAGEYLFFNAHVVDDIGVDEVGYKFTDSNGNVVSEELIPAPGNNHVDYYMANVNYRKEIEISNNLSPGGYKLFLFAKDKADNWIGKTDSSEIVSSDINIIGAINNPSNSITVSSEGSAKPDASILNEVEELLNTVEDEEEKAKVIELVVSDVIASKEEQSPNELSLARKYLSERSFGKKSLKERNVTLKEREIRLVRELGVPLQYGAPSSKNYTNVIKTEISHIAPSESGDYTTVSVQASLTPEVANSLASYDIEFLGHIQDPQNPEKDIIQSHLKIRCAADNDCTIYNNALSEINSPRVVITPVDASGNPLANETETKLSKDKLDKNGPKTPTITSCYPTSKQKGSGAFRLVVVGENFNEKSKIYFGDNELETNYVTPELLYAYVPAWFTISAKKIDIRVRKKAGGKTLTSNPLNFDITPKAQSHFVFDTEADFSKEILGNNLTLERLGGNIYIDNSTTVFKEAGEIVIPLSITSASNLTLEIKGSLISTERSPVLNLYHNNALVRGLLSSKSTTNEKSWKVDIGKLSSGAHTLKLTVPDLDGKTLFVFDRFILNFESTLKPRIKSTVPQSIYPLDTSDRKITITGENFGESPKVYYKGEVIASELLSLRGGSEEPTKQSPSGTQTITVILPEDLGLTEGQKYINIQVLNSETGIYSESAAVELRSDLKVNTISASYSFVSNALDSHGRLDVDVNTTSDSDTVYIGVYDENGKTVRDPYSIGKTNIFSGLAKAKFTLPYDLKEGTYYVLALAKRNTVSGKEDYSNPKIKELFDDLLEN